MTIGIYCIENTVDGKKYIGKSKHIEIRITQHKQALLKPVHTNMCNRHLWFAVQKHGWGAFKGWIVEEFSDIDETGMADREVYWMDFHKTLDREFGYNLKRDSSTLIIIPEETKRRISEANTGRKHTAETRANMSAAKIGPKNNRYGKTLTPEHIAIIINNRLGSKHSEETVKKMADRPVSEDSKKRMSESHKGISLSEDTKKRMSEAHKGKTFSAETRKKLSLGMLGENNHRYGKTASEETKRKMSDSHKGKVFSEEHRQNLSKAKKASDAKRRGNN